MENYELRVLFEKAAQALTGKVVTVRLRRPVISYFDGQAYIKDGRAFIDINPWLSEDDQVYVLCHECGHIKTNTATGDIDPHLSPGSLRLSQLEAWQYKNHPASIKRESAAESWAQKWLAYADLHYREYPGWSLAERKLEALKRWIPTELEAAVKRAASLGAAEALKSYKLRR
jgi:hypothetical protein